MGKKQRCQERTADGFGAVVLATGPGTHLIGPYE